MFARVIITFFSLIFVTLASSAELSIVHVYTGWRDAASFKRISEYFNGQENTSGTTILRTQPAQRAGFYFLVRIANPAGPRSAQARLEIIGDTSAKPVIHTFTVPIESGETVLQLGLTGTDWSDAQANPVAWKLAIIDSEGHVLATEKSYLWEKPTDH